MTVNLSSSYNDSLVHPDIPSIDSDFPLDLNCFISRPGSFIFVSYMITSIFLLLPLCIFIIYHGVQQWRQKRSTSSTATMSHSDSFTYHMVIMELIGVFGCFLCCCGIFLDNFKVFIVGFIPFSFTWFGQTLIHVLTCVERYLAVVHPITYLSLRKERGIRIRNVSTGCVWLICFVKISLMMTDGIYVVLNFFLLTLSFAMVSFCSLSVLRVLIRPGPGEQGGGRERVDQSKQRAFYTIMVILGVLVVRFTWNLIWTVLYVLESDTGCVITTSGIWCNLLSSLVLPLLFLHRAEKLVCFKNSIKGVSH